jgi:hypothetical protein
MSDFIPLEKDPKWNAFNDYTWESFQKIYLPKVDLISTVHPEVRKQYRAIRKLIAHSYFEYEFFDIAAGQMTMLVEMAMVWKYEQLTGEPWKRKTKKGESKRDLKNLFDWLNQNGHFATNFPTDTNFLRQVRNYYAHPKKHGFSGGTHLKAIVHLILFINELYDPNLITANRLSAPIENWLTSHETKRKVLRFPSGQLLISTIYCAFVDSSDAEPQYYFAAFPLFDFKKIDRSNPYRPATMYVVHVTSPKINSSSLSGTDVSSGDEIRIEFADPAISKFIDEWHRDLYSDTELSPQIPMWRVIEMQQFVEDLKVKYYEKLR